MPWRRRRGGSSVRRAAAARRPRTGCAASSTRRRSPPESALDREVEPVRRRARAPPRCAAPPPPPRSRPRCRTPPRRSSTRCTFFGDGSASTAACSSASRCAAAVEPAAREHVRQRGAVDARAARRRVLREVPEARGAATRSPPAGSASPAMTFSSDVLPAPLRPTRPTLSPGCSENEAPVVVNRPPTSTLRSRTWSTKSCYCPCVDRP